MLVEGFLCVRGRVFSSGVADVFIRVFVSRIQVFTGLLASMSLSRLFGCKFRVLSRLFGVSSVLLSRLFGAKSLCFLRGFYEASQVLSKFIRCKIQPAFLLLLLDVHAHIHICAYTYGDTHKG